MAYVYSHIRKDNGKCFYIGKGTGDRAYDFNRPYNKHYTGTVNKYGVDVKILVNNVSDEKALELEKSFIHQIGLKNLTNQQEGGQGGWGHITYEQRTTVARNGGANLGKTFSQEWKNNISKSNKAFGSRPMTEATKAKLAQSASKLVYKELTTGFEGSIVDMKNKFNIKQNVSIWGNAQHTRAFVRGKNKGLNFKIL